MQLQVADIKEYGTELQIEQAVDQYPILAQLAEDEGYVFLTPVQVTVSASVVGGVVELQGTLRLDVEIPCGRCLVASRYALEGQFHQSYVDELPNITGEDGEELELSAEEMGLEVFDGDAIDLTEEVQQQVLLLLPTHPLCSEECKGLCIECGADLNRESCRCQNQKVSMHFAALKDFKVEK
ncbi:MAG: hypothetical protein C0620_00405 [Desulfuromonas sp.]|nr:MAG: hypothetical protein C0620_00405 [Desulfuromonas sp.]